MQTMPSKTRTTMLIGGIAALVLVAGLIAFAINQRAKNEVGGTDPLAEFAEPPNGSALGTDPVSAAPGNTSSQKDAMTGESKTPTLDGATGVGNNTGLQMMDAATQALTTLGAVPMTHLVQPNETLYDISEKYYKTHIYAGDIESLNELSNPNMITAGMELKLPRPSELSGMGN